MFKIIATLVLNLKYTNCHTLNASPNMVSFRKVQVTFMLKLTTIVHASVATRSGCDVIFNNNLISRKFIAKYLCERMSYVGCLM